MVGSGSTLVRQAAARPWRGLWMRDRKGKHRLVVFVVFSVIVYRHLLGTDRRLHLTTYRNWQNWHKKGARVLASDLGR